ncbi:hypothetical protein DAEQUDRAFT_149316 [Daedalea quercina L-15889]|uniref:Uncharacterized protein n=1 Tax=Daedalea quercina L-15889 TaxID=1314783 RepID=A0A165KM31_9APHY|nr:hypothetical protein DAEQUDRAFT_149316 [Daedalea quercina L-15889]
MRFDEATKAHTATTLHLKTLYNTIWSSLWVMSIFSTVYGKIQSMWWRGSPFHGMPAKWSAPIRRFLCDVHDKEPDHLLLTWTAGVKMRAVFYCTAEVRSLNGMLPDPADPW